MSSKINLTSAKELYEEFLETKRKVLIEDLEEKAVAAGQNPNDVIESKTAWISLDDLKQYIIDIENQGSACGILSADMGFHIYFGAYNNTATQFKNQLTMMFVPTKDNLGTTEDLTFTETNGLLAAQEIGSVLNLPIANEKKSILNRLTLTPPPKQDTDMDKLIANVN